MNNVVTMSGEKMRTVEDVLHELSEKIAAGEVASVLVVIAKRDSTRSVDWSNMSMTDFVYSSSVVQHNMYCKMGEIKFDE